MSTAIKTNGLQEKSPVGLLLIIGDIISNEQRDEICIYIQRAFQYIDHNKYHEINDLFNNLIHENEFQADSQYRQMANTENGSIAGFLYLPNFHTLLNVFKDLFNICYHVCIIFCGQQIESNGGFILSDSVFTSDNFYNLFEENPSYVIQDLEIILPFVSNQWKRLANNYLQKHLQDIQINDLTNEIDNEIVFGDLFYERLYEVLNKDSIDFDIYNKLIPRDSSGTIAFDEPNLYILYGQQGEASLFGIRGFVVLVNGGFSRIPSYWNLIRGLQNIDACILTHFDYDVFPGLQTILHRKTIPSANDGQLCKPDIGAIFYNHIQRIKIQSIPTTKSSSSSNKLLMNLTENIDQFINNIQKLNINTFDLIKQNKSLVEPINLYKKIAFGSLDLYVLHPTTSILEDEKLVTNLQKIPIRDQQPSSSIIPLHHWYSSCSLLVWTPTSKSSKESLVRILYTGACPQTLIFEALSRVRNLDFLHESQRQQPQQQTTRTNNVKTTHSPNSSASIKQPPQKPKVSPPLKNRTPLSTVPNKPVKTSPAPLPRPVHLKPKTSPTTKTKLEKPRPAPFPKKAPPPLTSGSARSASKDTKTQKPRPVPSKTLPKPKKVLTPASKIKSQPSQVQKGKIQNKLMEKSENPPEDKQKLETQSDHQEELITENVPQEEPIIENEHEPNLTSEYEHEQKLETGIDEEPKLDHDFDDIENVEIENESKEEELLFTENKHEQNLESENEYEQKQETDIDNEHKLETVNSEDQQVEIQNDEHEQNDNDEQTEQKDELEMSADELNENDETFIENHEQEEVKRPEEVSLSNGQNEPFIESNTASPIDEAKSQLSPHDPMTMGFIEGAPETENPFNEQTDDEMEIIHHDITTSNEHPIPDEEIHPQGLPIENNIHSSKSTNKKLNTKSNRTNGSSTLTNNTNHQSSQKSSGSIFYVDVAYIPYNGNEHYVDSEFFRRIRARYYILNGVQINRLTLESLIDGKQQWENKEHVPVTLVPTFDGEQLRQFFMMNKNRLSELNINILPASIRCNVQYDDEGSPAQRLRFSSTDEQ